MATAFALDADIGIEVLFREIVSQSGIEEIFPEATVEGSKEFEPKDTNGEALLYSDSLIGTKFTDEFYARLVREANNASHARLRP